MHSKSNHEQNQTQLIEWEKIFANDVNNKELISQIHEQYQKNKQLNQKGAWD